MKKHQNRFLFSKEEANYYISKLSKAEFTRTEYESKLLILNLLLYSKQVRHFALCKSWSLSIFSGIHYVINCIKNDTRDDYYIPDLHIIIDWIIAHTIVKK